MKSIVIGTGKMGRFHARVYRDLGVLAGVCDTNTLCAHEVASQYGVKAYSSATEVINEQPDLVTIATPTPTHKELALQCISSNINVLIEKPIAMSIQEAVEIETAAANSKSIVTVGYIERYNPVFRELLQLVQDRVFGDITSVNIKRVGGIPRSADNVISDVMTHDIDLLLALFQREPEALYTHRRESGEIVHSAQALLDFGNASATCEANWVSPTKIRTIDITGTDSYAEVDMVKQEITQFNSNTRLTKSFNEEPLKNELQAFVEAIANRDDSRLVSVSDAVSTLRITNLAAREE